MLIFGESGTGKEACGRALHEASGRSGRLVSLNCGVLTGETVYSQLFGHRRGSFTDAVCDQAGRSSRPMAARCFSTKSGSYRCLSSRCFCARSKRARCCRSGLRGQCR